MSRPVRKRLWVELALGLASCILFLLTLATPEWIELVFRVDPDNGSGALEWAIVACLAVACSVLWRSASVRMWQCGRAPPRIYEPNEEVRPGRPNETTAP
jgi:hypothetical protein